MDTYHGTVPVIQRWHWHWRLKLRDADRQPDAVAQTHAIELAFRFAAAGVPDGEMYI